MPAFSSPRLEKAQGRRVPVFLSCRPVSFLQSTPRAVPARCPPSMSLSSIASRASPAADLAARARVLRHAYDDGTLAALLKGRNIGVVCEPAGQADALLAQGAALALGAQVALLAPGFAEAGAVQSLAPTARMLGRLYDAIVCVDLPDALARRLREEAGVPVLSTRPDAAGLVPDERVLAWQALLLDCFG
jgi:hypothetical protein